MPDEDLQGFGLTDDETNITGEVSEDATTDNNTVSLDALSDEEQEDDPDMDSFDDIDEF
jgi:hypothetical protein